MTIPSTISIPPNPPARPVFCNSFKTALASFGSARRVVAGPADAVAGGEGGEGRVGGDEDREGLGVRGGGVDADVLDEAGGAVDGFELVG
jgi:hypothetical protein